MFKHCLYAAAISLALAALTVPQHGLAADFEFHHENVLGTSLELKIQTSHETDARRAEAIVLEEIQRLTSVLSTWVQDSEISRLLASPAGTHAVSVDLHTVLGHADAWQAETHGAFNPRVQVLSQLWSEAEKRQQKPDAAALEKALQDMREPAWELTDRPLEVRVTGRREVTLSALAKAYILDKAGDLAFQHLPGEGMLLLNIGGDIRHWGARPVMTGIVNPRADEENREPLRRLSLRGQALASSGDYRRGWDIDGVHHSHVIDPRTGLPVTGIISTSVLAPDAVTANALAVSISVLGAEEGLRLISRYPEASCMIISSEGQIQCSPGWPAPADLPAVASAETVTVAPAATKTELVLTFEFPSASKRPYIAAWIADEDGFPVRTLLLWIEQGGKRRKWLPDLRQWYKDDKTRMLLDPTDLVETRSSATRRAGQYSVVWSGEDDQGKPVAPGSYTLLLEAAREKGSHQIIKHPFTWNGGPFSVELPGNREITSAKVECSKAP